MAGSRTRGRIGAYLAIVLLVSVASFAAYTLIERSGRRFHPDRFISKNLASYFSIPNLATARALLRQTALYALLVEPEVADFRRELAPFVQDEIDSVRKRFQAEFDLSTDQLADAADGEATIALDAVNVDEVNDEASFVLFLSPRTREKQLAIKDFLAAILKKLCDTPLAARQYAEWDYAVGHVADATLWLTARDNYVIAGFNEKHLQRRIDMFNRGRGSLEDSRTWESQSRQSATRLFHSYFAPKHVLSVLKVCLRHRPELLSRATRAWAESGISQVQYLAATGEVKAGRFVVQVDCHLREKDARPLSFLSIPTDKRLLSLIPEDASSYTIATLDVKNLLKTTMPLLGPGFELGKLKDIEKEFGLRPEDDLAGAFSGDLVRFSPAKGAMMLVPEHCVILRPKDPVLNASAVYRLQSTLETRYRDAVVAKELRGVKFWNILPLGFRDLVPEEWRRVLPVLSVFTPTVAKEGEYEVLGFSREIVLDTVERIRRPGDTIARNEAYRQALKRLPSGYFPFAYDGAGGSFQSQWEGWSRVVQFVPGLFDDPGVRSLIASLPLSEQEAIQEFQRKLPRILASLPSADAVGRHLKPSISGVRVEEASVQLRCEEFVPFLPILLAAVPILEVVGMVPYPGTVASAHPGAATKSPGENTGRKESDDEDR